MTRDDRRTAFAAQAIGLADLFRLMVAPQPIAAGGQTFTVELSAPDGPSTGGGKQATQHVKLVPAQGPVIVIGSANSVDHVATLRSHEHLRAIHRKRFGRDFPMSREQWDGLAGTAWQFFEGQGLHVSIEPFTPEDLPVRSAPSPRSTLWMWLLLGVLIVAGGAAVLLLVMR